MWGLTLVIEACAGGGLRWLLGVVGWVGVALGGGDGGVAEETLDGEDVSVGGVDADIPIRGCAVAVGVDVDR
jgi:hypothetical protein